MLTISLCNHVWCVRVLVCCFFFFKQKTAYEMRISDWSSDVCSSDLCWPFGGGQQGGRWQVSLYHTIKLTDKVLIGPGVPELDQIGRASCRERVCQYV